ncbi:sirohydrochlorin cobaltochelatase [Bacteroides intestinalis]|uniref:Sirohydrochlorin cobaltochelatase n=1 Tax=Bacteroides intestinalis TaxID=329854 RepID=A0A6N2U9Q6_9BACE|nr:sirohydrochlorin cobaltochelatase [Bacteroides intestinalis]
MRLLSLIILLTVSLLCPAHEGENFVANDMLASMKPGDKAALLMVHFGTTHDDTRALTIDAINAKAREAFPNLEMREAFTSRIIIRRLKARGIEKLTPLDAMLRLRSEGYTHVIIQSTNIIDGVEMESLRRDMVSVQPFFKEIRIGTPLLYSTEDAEKVVSILGERLDATAQGKKTSNKKSTEHFVLVGHGTYTPSTAIYSQMDYMLKAKRLKNFHVSTIEGYPTLDATLAQLKETRPKQVTLIPLLLVCGNHTKEDIVGVWKPEMEKAGYQANVRMQGLGEQPAIRKLYMEHIEALLK